MRVCVWGRGSVCASQMEASPVSEASSSPTSATPLISLQPARLEFRDVRVGVEQSTELQVTNNLASELELSIRAGNSERYSVSPAKISLRGGETGKVNVKLKLVRSPPPRRPGGGKTATGGDDVALGYRDHFYVKSIYFDQRFASVFFLASQSVTASGEQTTTQKTTRSPLPFADYRPPRHAPSSSSTTPREKQRSAVAFVDAPSTSSRRQDGIETEIDAQRTRLSTPAEHDASSPISTPPTVSTATFEAEEDGRQESGMGDIYDAFEAAAHVGDAAVDDDVDFLDIEDEEIDYEQSLDDDDDDDALIADETDAVISSLQRQLGEIDEELRATTTTTTSSSVDAGRVAVADTPGSRSAAVLSRAMESSTEELIAARRANEALRSRLSEAEAELEAMRAFQASLESATPDAQELVQAAVLRMGAVANEKSKQAAEHIESKDIELRREQDKLKELVTLSQELKGALVLAEEGLRRSESRCAEAIESRSALRLEMSKKDAEIITLTKQFEREKKRQRETVPDIDASRETVQQLIQENATLREHDAEMRSRLESSRKEMEIFQASLEQTRAELSMKRIQESERSQEHEKEIASLKREHEARESDLRLQVAELKATIETLNSTLPSAKEEFDRPIAELRRGIAHEFRLAKEEISDSIKHVFVAGTSEGSARDLVQHQTTQIADLQLQLAQVKSELRVAETCTAMDDDTGLPDGGMSTSSATLARMRSKIGQLAASEESARVALENAESRAFTAEQKVDDAERRIQLLQSELQESSGKLRTLETHHEEQKKDRPRMRAGTASSLEKTSREILDEIAQDSEMEMSVLRAELQKERENHICTKVTAEAEERRLQMHVEDLEHRLRHHANDGIIHKQRLLQTIRTLSSRSDLHKEAAKTASEISRLTRSESKLQSDVAFLENRVATLTDHLNRARDGVLKQLERSRRNYAEVETNTVTLDASIDNQAPDTSDAQRASTVVTARTDSDLIHASTTNTVEGESSSTRVENMQRELITRENQLSQTRANLEIAKIDVERLKAKTAELSKEVSDARDAVCERDRQLYDCREKTRQHANDIAARHRSEMAALSTRMAVAERREHEAVAAKEEAERRVKTAKHDNEKLLSNIASLRAVHERELVERKDNIRLTEEENAKSMREIEQLSSLVEEKTVQIQVLTDTLEALQTSSKSEIEQGIVTMSAQLAALKAQEQCTERRARDAVSNAESSRRLLEMSQGDLKECKEVLMSRDAQIAEYRNTVDAADQEAQSMRLELRAYEERIASNARELDDLEDKVRKKDVELEGVRRALAAQRQRHFEELTAERATMSGKSRADAGSHVSAEAVSALATSSKDSLAQMISKLTSELAEQRKDVLWDKTEKEASRHIIDFLCTQLLDVDRRLNRALVEGRQSSSRCVSAEARSRQLETELDIELSSGIEMRHRVDMAENLRDRQRTIVLEHTEGHMVQQGRRVAVLSSALEKANKALMALESKSAADERQHAVTVGTLESTAHALRLAQAEHVEMRAEVMALTEELEGCRGEAVDTALNDFYATYVEGTLSDEKTKSGRFAMLTRQILALKYNEQTLQSSLSSSKTRLSGCQQKLVRVSEELRALQRRNELLTSGKEPSGSAVPDAAATVDVGSAAATKTANDVTRQLSVSSQENQALQQSCWNLRQRVAELELELDGVRSHAKALDESAKLTQSQHRASLQGLREQLSSEFATRLQHAHDDTADASKRFAVEIAKLKSEHESAMQLLQEEHTAKLSKLETQHEAHTGRLNQIHQENIERAEHDMVPREHMTKEQETSKYLRGQLEVYIAENDQLAAELHEIASKARTLEQDLECKEILIANLESGLSKGGGEQNASKSSETNSKEGSVSALAKQHISAKLHEADLVRKIRVAARTEVELRELVRRRDERIEELKSQVAGGSSDDVKTHITVPAGIREEGEDEPASSIEPHAAGLRSKLAMCESELDTMKRELAMTLAKETTHTDASREDYKLLYQQFENLTGRADLVGKQLKDLQAEASFVVGLIVGAVAKTHKSYNHAQMQESLSLKGAVQLILARMADYESRIKALKSELAGSTSSNRASSSKSKEKDAKAATAVEPMKVSTADVDFDGSQKRLIASLQNRVAQLGRERINLLQDKDKLSERLRGIRQSLGHGSKYPRRARSKDADASAMVNGAVQTDACETAGATQEYAEAWKTRCRMLEEEIESLREFTTMRDREMQQHVQDASDAYLSQLQTEDILSEAFDAARSQEVTPSGDTTTDGRASSSQLQDSRRREVAFMLKEKEMHAMRARRDSESELEKLRGDIVELKAAVLYERSSSARTREELSSALERLHRCTTEEESMRRRMNESSEQCERLRDAHDELAKVNASLKLQYRNAMDKLELAQFSISTRPASQEHIIMLVEQKLLALEKSTALFQRSSSAALEKLSRRADGVERLSADGARQSSEAMAEIEELARDTEAQTAWLTSLVKGAEDAKWAYSSRSSKLLQRAEQASFEVEEERSARAAIQTKADALERKVEHLESTASRSGKLAKLTRQVSDLQTKLTRSTEETGSLKAERDDLRGKLREAEKISSGLTSSLQATQAELTRIIQGSKRPASSSLPSSRSKSAKTAGSKHLVSLQATSSSLRKKKLLQTSTAARAARIDLSSEIESIEAILTYERERLREAEDDLEAAANSQATLRDRNKNLNTQMRVVRERNQQLQVQVKKLQDSEDSQTMIANITNVVPTEIQQQKSALASLRRQLVTAQNELSQRERSFKASEEQKDELVTQVKDLQRRLRQALTTMTKRDEQLGVDSKTDDVEDLKQRAAEADGKITTLQARVRDLSANLKRKDTLNGELREQNRRLAADLDAAKVTIEVEASKTSSSARRLRSDLAKKDAMIKEFQRKMTDISASTAMATSEAAAASRREVQAWRVAGADAAVMRHCAAVMLGSLQEAALLCLRVTGGMRRLAYVCCVHVLRREQQQRQQRDHNSAAMSSATSSAHMLQLPTDDQSIASIAEMVGLQRNDVSDLLNVGQSVSRVAAVAKRGIEFDKETKLIEEDLVRKLCSELEAGLGKASVSDAALSASSTATPAAIVAAKGALVFDEEPLHKLLELLEQVAMKAEAAAAEARGAVKIGE